MPIKEQELYYPLKREKNDSYIIFTPRVFNYAENIMTQFVRDVGKIKNSDDIVNIVKKIPETGKKLANNALNFSRDNFGDLLTDAIQSKSSEGGSIKLKISLPMRKISTSLSHDWKSEDVFQGAGGGLAGAAAKVLGKNIQSKISDGLKSVPFVGEYLSEMGGSLYQSALSSSGQYIQQPTRAVYGGSGNTDVKLDYLFSPQSPEEAVMIKKIVTMFRFLSTTQSGKDAYNKAIPLAKNPAIWKLSFLNRDGDKEDYKQYKNDITDRLIYANENTKKNVLPYMVLKSVDADFGGNDSNWVSFPDGFPPEISLSLSFSSYFSVQSAQTLFGYSSVKDIIEDGAFQSKEPMFSDFDLVKSRGLF